MLAVGVDQRVPLALGAVEALEVAVDAALLLVDHEHVLQALDGPLGLAELLLPDLRHALVEAHALGLGRGHLQLVLEDLEVRLHAAGLLVELLQRLERRQVLRVDGQDLVVGLDGALVVAQPRLPQLADLQAQLDRQLDVVDDLRLLGQHVDQAVPGLGAAVQAFERVDGAHAALVAAQRPLVGGRRLRGVGQLDLVGVGQRQAGSRPCARVSCSQLGVLGQDRRPVPSTAALAVEVLQRRQRADVLGVERQRLLRRGDGVVDVVERRVVPARDLDPQIRRLLRVGDALHDLRVFA